MKWVKGYGCFPCQCVAEVKKTALIQQVICVCASPLSFTHMHTFGFPFPSLKFSVAVW